MGGPNLPGLIERGDVTIERRAHCLDLGHARRCHDSTSAINDIAGHGGHGIRMVGTALLSGFARWNTSKICESFSRHTVANALYLSSLVPACLYTQY